MLNIDYLKTIKSKGDFLEFLSLLRSDYLQNKDSWENNNLDDYLRAMGDWIESMEHFYINTDQPVPTDIPWKVFADILIASKM